VSYTIDQAIEDSGTKLFVLVERNSERLIGLDSASGGYPWFPSSFTQIKIWLSYEEADRYRRTEQDGHKKWAIYSLWLDFEEYEVEEEELEDIEGLAEFLSLATELYKRTKAEGRRIE